MGMHHGQVLHAACPVHVHAACLCPYCKFMSMLHVHVHAACHSTCFVSMPMLHPRVCGTCLCPGSMDMDLQHGRGQQHGHGFAART
jgi:hypothetical protein